ncbi:hypothetical protein [Marinobacterium sedimentorum]|uniref:hypothetical protein n=1 Tax=Marinobacterium sedimentorum TaxID=2927804 RepID=UPI0020C6E8B7|nr:hypothetical protein [Marinobacterium sedimentorum]MCP8688259.1 hypothetical protein [Marinobacterium sedimentorum]
MKILACGVCRTYGRLVDGELLNLQMPVISGHGHSRKLYPYSVLQPENLCDQPLLTGYTRDEALELQNF